MLISLFRNLPLYLSILSIAGCAITTQISNTPRSSIEQQLLVRALERALANLDTQRLRGKTVAIDFYGLTADKDFAKGFFTAWLQSQRVRIAAEPKQAELSLKVFASVLAVDQGQSFVGTPAFTVPLIGFVVPEIALFKDVKHSGHAEIKVATIDGESGEFVHESPPSVGTASHDDYTILILVHFTRSDPEKPKWDLGAG